MNKWVVLEHLCLCSFQTQVGGDYYTGEYDYITLDGSQPETGTAQGQTTAQGQVRFRVPTSVRLMWWWTVNMQLYWGM